MNFVPACDSSELLFVTLQRTFLFSRFSQRVMILLTHDSLLFCYFKVSSFCSCHISSVEQQKFLVSKGGSLFSCVVKSLSPFHCPLSLSVSLPLTLSPLVVQSKLFLINASLPPTSHRDNVQHGLIQVSEKRCVNSLVSHRAHWTTAMSALRPLGLKSVTFDPWETLVHNDAVEQSGLSSICPLRATVDHRSYNLSWIQHSPGSGSLPLETTGLVEQPGTAKVAHTQWCWNGGFDLCVFGYKLCVCVYVKGKVCAFLK